jgi:hypothetical protein
VIRLIVRMGVVVRVSVWVRVVVRVVVPGTRFVLVNLFLVTGAHAHRVFCR